MKKVGFVGWRGLIGSVLLQRMLEENDFDNIQPIFFSTSNTYSDILLNIKNFEHKLQNAWDIFVLSEMDIIITCYGSNYTNKIYYRLRNIGWKGYWIDTSSFLRMNKDVIIALDPINQSFIDQGLNKGIKTFVCGNCTVNLMLMSLGELFIQDLIDWVSVSTYQAASGGGSQLIRRLLNQIGYIYEKFFKKQNNFSFSILDIEYKITNLIINELIKYEKLNSVLAFNIIPWIDEDNFDGQSKEEWKMQVETNKILNRKIPIKIESLCVRVNTLRCHSQSFLIKLKKNISIIEIEKIIKKNKWVRVIPNNRLTSIQELNPVLVAGSLKILVGRIRKLSLGSKYISIFTIGDQLLWGGAEPVRRMLLKII